MQFGFAPIQSEPTYEAMIAQARRAESLGFDVLWVHVVGSRAEKRRAEELFAERFLSFYDRWGHADVVRLDSRERVFEETSREHFIVGEASECTERINEYAEMGVGHVACLMNFGKPDRELVDRSLDRFGKDVLPHCAGR